MLCIAVLLYCCDVIRYDFASTHRVPISHHWESSEAQLLAVEATENTEEEGRADAIANEAVTMFVTAEDGVIVQHRIGLSHTDGALIGIQVRACFSCFVQPCVHTHLEYALLQKERTPSDGMYPFCY